MLIEPGEVLSSQVSLKASMRVSDAASSPPLKVTIYGRGTTMPRQKGAEAVKGRKSGAKT